jgi:hypothetical protein
MRDKWVAMFKRIAIRTVRVAAGGTIACLVFLFGFGYSRELLTLHSLVGFVDGLVAGVFSLMGLVIAFFIAFGTGEKRAQSTALALPTPNTNRIHRIRNQQSTSSRQQAAVDVGRGIGRFVARLRDRNGPGSATKSINRIHPVRNQQSASDRHQDAVDVGRGIGKFVASLRNRGGPGSR